MLKGPIIHWQNGTDAVCGAPAGSHTTEYQHVVTCRTCLAEIQIDILRRRLQAHRASVALGGLVRSKVAESQPRGSPVPSLAALSESPKAKS